MSAKDQWFVFVALMALAGGLAWEFAWAALLGLSVAARVLALGGWVVSGVVAIRNAWAASRGPES